jgi:hypothetical protein
MEPCLLTLQHLVEKARPPAGGWTLRRISADWRYLARATLAGGAMLLWTAVAVGSFLGAFKQPSVTRTIGASSANSESAVGAPVPSISYYDLMKLAAGTCLEGSPVLVVSDDWAAIKVVDYYIYPRKTIPLKADAALNNDMLDAHRGDCLTNYGSESVPQLAPFLERLRQIECSGRDCLYIVEQ